MEGQSRVSIEGINRHSTADAFSTRDPGSFLSGNTILMC